MSSVPLSETFRETRLPLAYGDAAIPAVGFGTLIRDRDAAKQAVRTALEVGYRHLDCAEIYGNEDVVGEAIRDALETGIVSREELFVTTKLWNTNHRPERVAPALAWAVQRGTALLTTSTSPDRIRENFEISPLPPTMPCGRSGTVLRRASASTPW